MIVGLLEKELCSLVVLDSHTSAIPIKIIEGEMGMLLWVYKLRTIVNFRENKRVIR